MTTEWYYAKENQTIGPISESELRQRASTGQIAPTDLVWTHGMLQWATASTVHGLFAAVSGPPPLPFTTTTSASSETGTSKPTVIDRDSNYDLDDDLIDRDSDYDPDDDFRPSSGTSKPIVIDRDMELEKKLNMSLAELNLSVRATNCLESVGINTVRDLMVRTEDHLLQIRNFGETTLDNVRERLSEIGLRLGMLNENVEKVDDAAVYRIRAESHLSEGNYDEAFIDATEAIRLDPNNASAYRIRAQSYLSEGTCESAIADATEAIRLDPNSKLWLARLDQDYTRSRVISGPFCSNRLGKLALAEKVHPFDWVKEVHDDEWRRAGALSGLFTRLKSESPIIGDPSSFLLTQLNGHRGSVSCIEFSPDGRLLASGGFDKTVRIWNVASMSQVAVLSGHLDTVSCVKFSPTTGELATSDWAGTIRIWDIETRKTRLVLKGHRAAVNSIAYHPSGQRLASCGEEILIWDAVTGTKFIGLDVGPCVWIRYRQDGAELASSKHGVIGGVVLMNGTSLESTGSLFAPKSMGIDYSPDGSALAAASCENIAFWDGIHQKNGKTRSRSGKCWRAHQHATNSVSFSPDGTLLASTGDDGLVKVWPTSIDANVDDVASNSVSVFPRLVPGVEIALVGHKGPTTEAVFSPDGKLLASVGADSEVFVWDAQKCNDQIRTRNPVRHMDHIRRLTTMLQELACSTFEQMEAAGQSDDICFDPDVLWCQTGQMFFDSDLALYNEEILAVVRNLHRATLNGNTPEDELSPEEREEVHEIQLVMQGILNHPHLQ